MIVGIIVARFVGPSVVGSLAYALAFVSMFNFIADFGTGTSFLKLKNEKNISSPDLISSYFILKMILIVIYVFMVLIAIYFSEYDRNLDIVSNLKNSNIQLIFIYLIITIIGFFYSIQSIYWAAETKQVLMDLPELIKQLVYQVLRLIGAILGFKAVGLALTNLVAVISVSPFHVIYGRSIKFGKYNIRLIKKILQISTPVILLIIFQTLIFSTDKVILKQLTDENVVGKYTVAYSLASFIKTIELVAGGLFFVYISRYLSESNIDTIVEILNRFGDFYFIFILPLLIFIALLSNKIIILLYGHAFAEASGPFYILIFTFAVNLFTLPFGNIVFGSGKYLKSVFIWFCGLLIYIPSIFIFLHKDIFNMEGTGAALSLFLSMFIILLLSVYFSKSIINFKFNYLKKKLIFSIVYLIIGSIFYYSFINELNIKLTIILSLTYFLFFYFIIFSFKIADNISLSILKNAFSVSRMETYIKNELFNTKKDNF